MEGAPPDASYDGTTTPVDAPRHDSDREPVDASAVNTDAPLADGPRADSERPHVTRGPVECATSGGTHALHSAALGLEPGQWCQMAPNVEADRPLSSLFRVPGCGGDDDLIVYAVTMAWDEEDEQLWWVGTGHSGTEGMIAYDAATNTWTAEDAPSQIGGLCHGEPCTPSAAPWTTPRAICGGNANHAYDTIDSFDGRYIYYRDFARANVRRYDTETSTWNTSWGTVPLAVHTPAVVYWPEHHAIVFDAEDALAKVLYTYELGTGRWTRIFEDDDAYSYHDQIERHPTSGEILFLTGNRYEAPSPRKQYRIRLVGGAPVVTRLATAPIETGLTASKCVADPHSHNRFVFWNHEEDSIGTSTDGWYEYDMDSDTWTTFAALGIPSMPPLYGEGGGGDDPLMAAIPNYDVVVFMSERPDDGSSGGMYVYKHN